MKPLILILIIIFSLLLTVVLAEPNEPATITTYEKLDPNTLEMTVVTTYIKSTLEAEKVILIQQRDRRIQKINDLYQPQIDEIDTKLELFE